jgi:hypothetical protein
MTGNEQVPYGPPSFHPLLPGDARRMYLPADEVTALLRWYAGDLRSLPPEHSSAEHEMAKLLDAITDDIDCTLTDYMTRQMGWRTPDN